MGTRLRCLLVEDSESDALLIVRGLQKAGYEVVHERVETAGQMRAALEERVWDAIIADYTLPEFSGPAALALLKETGRDLPFIVISGVIGEEAAIALMAAGAHDFLRKGDLARLGPAIQRELGDAEARREHRRAEDALRESEARFRSVVENAPEGIYAATRSCFRYLNPVAISLLGASSDLELLHRPVLDRIHPDDRAAVAERIEQVDKLRMTIPLMERKYLKLDGTLLNLEVCAAPCTYDGENGALVFFRDIAERKRIADALRRSEERFRQVAEDAGVFVWEVDADGLYTYASPVVKTILGYTPDELIGRLHHYDLFAPADREELKAIVTEAFAQRRSFSSFLNANLRKDGTIVVLETSGVPLLEEGNLLGYRGTDRDVTDRARATEELRRHRDHLEELVRERTAELEEKNSKLADEIVGRTYAVEAYRQSEARLQLQFDCMPVACITIGPDSRIRSWNPAAARIFGYSTTEAVGAPAVDLVVPEDLRSELGPFLRRLLEATGTVHLVSDNLTKDGRRITCEWTNTRLLDPDGTVRDVLCMVQDITFRKQAEEALKRKTDEMEAFNKAMIGREKRVIELKEEVNGFCLRLKQPPAYPPVWKRDEPANGLPVTDTRRGH